MVVLSIFVGGGVGWFGGGRGCDRMGEICVVAEGDDLSDP